MPPSNDDIFRKAIASFQAGHLDEAERSFRQVVQQEPTHVGALNLLSSLLAARGRYAEAEPYIKTALKLNSSSDTTFYNYGVILKALQRPDEALERFGQALAINSAVAETWNNRGTVFNDLKRHDEAVADFNRAIALQPNYAGAYCNKGKSLVELKRFEEALDAYDKALALNPSLAEAWLGRGNVFYRAKRYDEALADYDRALAQKPDLAEVWVNRGNVFNKLRRHEDAVRAYAKVLEIDAQYPFVKGTLLHQKMLCCDWNKIGDLIADIEKDIASGRPSAEPFGYQANAYSALNFRHCAEIYAAAKFPRSQNPLWRGERYHNEKIRIGYVSGELRTHAVSILMAEMFERHDKNRFELFAFDNGWDDGSALRKRINAAFDTIIDISRMNDGEAAALIRQHQIDILVDLNGYHGEGRTGIFSRKPSPVQVNYLGFTSTMGADFIDYIIADSYVIPPAHQEFYTEKVVYLPDTYQASDSKRAVAERTPTRAELNLPETAFVFCCFNNNFKITPEAFDVWMRLLNKVENSVLWLTQFNEAVCGNLRAVAKHRGVSPERLIFAPHAEYADYVARYRLADLFLDTIPFNAGATANDALWAGLPVLTCSGQPFAARMAGSLLTAIALPELITTTLQAYEQMAMDLAMHPEKLALIKRKLAANRHTMPLFNTKLFTKNIEAAYTAMYERYQTGLAPDHIVVPRAPD